LSKIDWSRVKNANPDPARVQQGIDFVVPDLEIAIVRPLSAEDIAEIEAHRKMAAKIEAQRASKITSENLLRERKRASEELERLANERKQLAEQQKQAAKRNKEKRFLRKLADQEKEQLAQARRAEKRAAEKAAQKQGPTQTLVDEPKRKQILRLNF
jgi:asparagine synthetase B (glutamine-hydrolysing)